MIQNRKTESFETLAGNGCDNVFIFGDHASKFIPSDLNDLGLKGDDLTRHIAWDIGTDVIVRRLCETLKCPGQLAGFSRLVIDCNRSLDAEGLIVSESDGTLIPGNQNLSNSDRQARIDRFYTPYHAQLSDCLDTLDNPFVISIHSFTPHPRLGEYRSVEMGLLARYDMESAEYLLENFKTSTPPFHVAVNQPYSAFILNHTVDTHIAPRQLRHLAIEVRQDHIDTEAKAVEIADILSARISSVIAKVQTPLIA